MVLCTVEQCVFLHKSHVKCGFAGKYQQFYR